MAYSKKDIDLEVVDIYHLLLDHDWFYVAEYVDENYKTGNEVLDELKWREFSIHPPKELHN